MRAVLRTYFFLALSLVVSCGKPASYEQFVRVDQAADGVYSFDLDFTDSTAVYDIGFYTPAVDGECSLPLAVSWFSGDGLLQMEERVYLALGREDVIKEYRTRVSPAPAGVWELKVRVTDAPEGFLGLGITCKRYGTR